MAQWTQENWKILTGIAFFLLAIHSMEGSVAEMSGRKFKLFLKRETGNIFKAAATSTLITSVLQSSSLVNLVVMDMLGSGIIPLKNALALTLGANLGTTVNSWLVVLLGFNTNLENWIFPVTGITGILMSLLPKASVFRSATRLLFSLSLLLFSLDMIKTGGSSLIAQTSLHLFETPVVFLLFGLLATAFVQASSIIMVLTLAALYTGTIEFNAACAVVLGGEIGTTLKFFIASRGSSAVKKRMALGNFLFNLIAAIIILLFLTPICNSIIKLAGVHNQLFAVVIFQTSFNIFGILLFLPWLNRITTLLSRMFTSTEKTGMFIQDDRPTDNVKALADLENETIHLINCTAAYMTGLFHHSLKDKSLKDFAAQPTEQQYLALKQLHGRMHKYSLHIRNTALTPAMVIRLDQLTASMRNAMYAAKSTHNVESDIKQLSNSSKNAKYRYYQELATQVPAFCHSLLQLINDPQKAKKYNLGSLTVIYQDITDRYRSSILLLYGSTPDSDISDVEITTMINTNREIHSAFKSMFYGVIELLLTPADTERFEQQPGFIR